MKHVRGLEGLSLGLVLLACSSASAPRATGGSGGEAETGGKAGGTGGKMGGTGGSTGGAVGTGGSPATGGSPGQTGGSSGADAAVIVTPDSGTAPSDAAPTVADAEEKLMECPKASIDRITAWNATGEGTTRPMSGSLLVKEGDHYIAKQEFVGGGWHVLEVFIANAYGASADLTGSTSFTLTYSSTADLWVQMRPSNHYSGGAQWVTKIPSTGGQMMKQTFSLEPTAWTSIELGKPTWPYADARKAACGFVFVGNQPNMITFRGLRFDKYIPMCR